MKKIIAIMMIVLLCLSVCACKDDTKPAETNAQKTQQSKGNTDPLKAEKCTEQTILMLFEKNLDCHAIFYVTPLLTTTQQNSDGYLGVDAKVMKDYDALSKMVHDTYTKETADSLLSYPSKETPLYKSVDGFLFAKPDVAQFDSTYYAESDSAKVKILSSDNKKCEFEISFSGSENKTKTTSAVYEDGKWVLTEVIS